MTDFGDTSEMNRARLLQLMLQQVRESAFIFLDPRGRIVEWSRGAEHLFGFPRDAALGQEFSRLFSNEDVARGIAELEIEIADSDAISEDDRWHVRTDGSRFWSTGSLTALRAADDSPVGFVKILRDRTNLKEQIELLTHQLAASRDSERSQEIFIAKFSHELRNLLAALQHGLQLIGSPRADEARRDSLSHIMQEQIEVVGRLAEDLLDIERVKEGKLTLRTQPLILQDAIGRATEILRPRIEDKRLRLDLLEPGVAVRVDADPARLVQVFVNLIENAVKYTPSGGRIWVKLTVEDPDAVVHIEDTGIGIPPHMLSNIFDLFTQVEADASNKGLGIGLALVRDLLLMHKGSIQARSEGVGKGALFTVRLPLSPPN